MSLRPRSFSGLILACFAGGSAVPLIVPLIYGAASINQFSKQGAADGLYQVEQIDRYSKILVNQMEKMDDATSSCRAILNDASVLDGYYQSRKQVSRGVGGPFRPAADQKPNDSS